MPNFDSLRSSIIAPLEYICRPKEKPAELLALFPMNGDMLDLSRYGRTMSIGTTPAYTSDGPLGQCAAFKGAFVHDSTTAFTIDFFANMPNGEQYGGNLFPNCSPSGSAGVNGGGFYGVNNQYLAQITGSNVWLGGLPGTFSHFALTYNGSTLCMYLDGTRKFSSSVSLYPQSSVHFTVNNGKYCNFRVLSKCLTTGSTFPVPTDFYTGYEVL